MTCHFCGYVMAASEKACPRCGVSSEHNVEKPRMGNAGAPHNSVGFADSSTSLQHGGSNPQHGGSNAYPQPGPYAPVTPAPYDPTRPGGSQHSPVVPPYSPPAAPPYNPAGAPANAPQGKSNSSAAWIIAALLGVALVGTLMTRSPQAPPAPQAPPTTAGAPAVASVPAAPPVKIGPSFFEVDARMDDRLTGWTEAQKQTYWASVTGSQITWTGEVVEVEISSGGKISLKCNPKTWTADVRVTLDGSQIDRLPAINKGQRITIQGILQEHSRFGYRISQGRVLGL